MNLQNVFKHMSQYWEVYEYMQRWTFDHKRRYMSDEAYLEEVE